MTDRELMQQALDALMRLEQDTFHPAKVFPYKPTMIALRARLARPNDFNPDWDAMAVMVEEQQRMAKRIEELEARLAQPEPEPVAWYDVEHGETETIWSSQRPSWEGDWKPLYTAPPPHSATHSADSAESFCKLEPVAWTVRGLITDFRRDFSAYQTKTYTVPLYTAPPQREWQTLTENEIKHLWYEACQTNLELTSQLIVHLARNIEAKLKEKNT